MNSNLLLTVDQQPISVDQALKHLQSSGKLQPFIGEILRQYTLERELQDYPGLDIDPALVEQQVIEFRLEQQLTNKAKFQEWLASNGMDYSTFHNQVLRGFKLAKLKTLVSESKLTTYFIEQKLFLDKVILSRIVVADRELALELQSQIQEGTRFEQLAQEYSVADDRIVNGMMGPVSRGNMPDVVRAAVDAAHPGALVGPIELEGRWYLFQVEQFLPASLTGQLQQELQEQLFEQWLTAKIQKMQVKLEASS